MPLTVGGGIRTLDDIRALLNAGSDKVSINSAAVTDPEFVSPRGGSVWQPMYCSEHRSKESTQRWQRNLGSAYQRWTDRYRARSGRLGSARRRARRGRIVLTSMDADGTKDGYDLEITAAVSKAVSIPVVASGGPGLQCIWPTRFAWACADAALAASIFHFGEYTIGETKRVMQQHGISVRL